MGLLPEKAPLACVASSQDWTVCVDLPKAPSSAPGYQSRALGKWEEPQYESKAHFSPPTTGCFFCRGVFLVFILST